MKKIVPVVMLMFSMPVLAAKIKDAKCSDFAGVNEKVSPEYLAVIDGYNKAGKKVSEEIDIADIVSESKKINEQCAQNKGAKIDKVRKDIKSASSAPTAAGASLNPTKATCKDFIALGEELQPVAAFWVAGHDRSGKIKKGEVDEEFLSKPVATLIEDCKAQPTASFYDRTKAWLHTHL
jgi:acid stress chaperone HdeA